MKSKTTANILIIDDDEDVLLSAKMLLKNSYSQVLTLNDPKKINEVISRENIDLIVLDMNYRIGINDGKEGMYWLEHILSINDKIVVILMTAYGEVELAVKAVKMGAFDFILKPWTNEKFLATVQAGIRYRTSNQEISRLKSANAALSNEQDKKFGSIVGESSSMQELMTVIEKVSKTDASVLILGENGTGKQHIAREIHKRSTRANGPFIHVDLGSLSENLFESELFGHKKGAFTDAHEDRPGRFELAENGTLFLDEIGNLPLNLQSKLLTALQDRKTTRIGESIERPFNARLLFATNAQLSDKVKEGAFRQDLLFRINTIEVMIPPLRRRTEDIPAFAQFFLHQFREKYLKPSLEMSSDAIDMLRDHHWPGNVRELQHTIERGVIMSEGTVITPSDFNLNDAKSKNQTTEFDSLNLQDLEKALVQKALEKHDSNISKAAKELGLTRAALYRRMEKFNL